MTSVTLTDFRSHASGMLTRVEHGETLVVLRHGRPVAEVSPVSLARAVNPHGRDRALAWSRRGRASLRPSLRSVIVKAYLDSSAFAKRFTEEQGSDTVEAVADMSGQYFVVWVIKSTKRSRADAWTVGRAIVR